MEGKMLVVLFISLVGWLGYFERQSRRLAAEM
jgi:hypothetical protein